jgi:hypothetical protein
MAMRETPGAKSAFEVENAADRAVKRRAALAHKAEIGSACQARRSR